jgi:hypothetical protein
MISPWRSLLRMASAMLGTACALLTVTTAAQTSVNELPGATYASLAELPNWSGWWLADDPRTSAEELDSQPLPFTPDAEQARSASFAADAPNPLRHCQPWQFTGVSGGFTEALEFLFTPERVTLTNERGLIRRIYTDGRPMPDDLEYTNTGTSMGHWDGETLIIETAGIDPRALYPTRGPRGIPFGENVVIRERIFLVDENTLRFDIETVAPDIFTVPDRRSQLYRRLRKMMANEVSWCSEFDRSVDPRTGEQRFDMTPPPDLPPPPTQ